MPATGRISGALEEPSERRELLVATIIKVGRVEPQVKCAAAAPGMLQPQLPADAVRG